MIHRRFCKVCAEIWQNYNIFKLLFKYVKIPENTFSGLFKGAKIQNFSFGGNHGATLGRHWVHYKPPVLGTLGVGTYVTWWWWTALKWLTDKSALGIISTWYHCQRLLPSQISNTLLLPGFEPAQSLFWFCSKQLYYQVQSHLQRNLKIHWKLQRLFR